MAGLTREQRAAKAAAQAEANAASPHAGRIAVLERRLQNPLGEPSAPVRLKDPTLCARWFNASARPDNIWRAKELGWEGLRPEDIVDISQIGTHILSPEGFVARGERAQEILMGMPKAIYDKIQWAKTKKNLELMKDQDRQKHDMMNAAAKQFGGNVADFMNTRVGPVGRVTDQYERIEQLPHDEARD